MEIYAISSRKYRYIRGAVRKFLTNGKPSKCYDVVKYVAKMMGYIVNDNSYRCKICGKRFDKKVQLVNHIRSHGKEIDELVSKVIAAYVCADTMHSYGRCKICGKRFTRNKSPRYKPVRHMIEKHPKELWERIVQAKITTF